MFSGFREHKVRRNPWYHTFDPNTIIYYVITFLVCIIIKVFLVTIVRSEISTFHHTFFLYPTQIQNTIKRLRKQFFGDITCV